MLYKLCRKGEIGTMKTLFALLIFVACAALYAVIGYGIAVPYTWLANGNRTSIIVVTIVSPMLLMMLCLFYKIDHQRHYHRFQWLGGKISWTYVVWVLSPLMMNGLSHVIRSVNLQNGSDFVFRCRFTGLWLIPIIITVIYVSKILYSDAKVWYRRHMTTVHFARD